MSVVCCALLPFFLTSYSTKVIVYLVVSNCLARSLLTEAIYTRTHARTLTIALYSFFLLMLNYTALPILFSYSDSVAYVRLSMLSFVCLPTIISSDFLFPNLVLSQISRTHSHVLHILFGRISPHAPSSLRWCPR